MLKKNQDVSSLCFETKDTSWVYIYRQIASITEVTIL